MVGKTIAKLRKEKNITQKDMSEKIGINRSVLVKIEKGQRTISADEVKCISSFLGVKVDVLFELSEQENCDFITAYKKKCRNITQEQEKEMSRFELLFDELCVQLDIYEGK